MSGARCWFILQYWQGGLCKIFNTVRHRPLCCALIQPMLKEAHGSAFLDDCRGKLWGSDSANTRWFPFAWFLRCPLTLRIIAILFSGSHSAEDGGCLSRVPIFTAEDCSADGTSPHLGDAGTTWTGSAWTAAYYLNDSASSPYT